MKKTKIQFIHACNYSGKVSLTKVILISVAAVMVIVAISFLKFFTPGASLMVAALLDKATKHRLTESLNSAQNSLDYQSDLSGGLSGSLVKPVSSDEYIVKQKSSLPFSLSAPQGVMDAKATINFITVGYAMSPASAGRYGWQTDWKVIINSTVTDLGTKTQFSGPSGLNSSALTTDFSDSNMQTVMYFSLAGKKEGDKVPVRYTMKTTEEATYHFNENNWIFYDEKNHPFAAVAFSTGERDADTGPSPADAKNLDAVLVKDNGAKGVILGFPPQEMTASQKSQLEEINSYINSQQDAGGLKGFWNNQIYPMASNTPQQPPLHIILKADVSAEGYLTESRENAEHWNAAPGVNVGNTGGNGGNKTPDLAPLPSQNDANGDGIPDLVPLPGSN